MKTARRIDKWAIIWPAIVLVLLVGLGAMAIGLHAANTADQARQGNGQTVQQLRRHIACINHSLAVRQRYINEDHGAEVAKVSGQVRGLLRLRSDPEAGVLQFTRASEHYLARIAAIDREQKQHPLGRC